jgi:hypothetical protein
MSHAHLLYEGFRAIVYDARVGKLAILLDDWQGRVGIGTTSWQQSWELNHYWPQKRLISSVITVH